MEHAFGDLIQILGIFGGISLLVWTATQAKIARIKAERGAAQPNSLPQDAAIVVELKALQQQMAEMHSTSHQFDISFDEALSRLEGRVGRLETKNAAGAATTPNTLETPNTLRNGQPQ